MPLPDLTARLGALPGLMDPSARPEEPVTAGVPIGAGPGPMNRPPGGGGIGWLRRMVQADPDPELFALLAEAERAESGGFLPGPRLPKRRIEAEDDWNLRDRATEAGMDASMDAFGTANPPPKRRIEAEDEWNVRDRLAERDADFALEAENQGIG